MSSRFKTIRSNRKWMIKSKVLHPLCLTVTFYLRLHSSLPLLFNACLFPSIPLCIILSAQVLCYSSPQWDMCGWMVTEPCQKLTCFFFCVCICGKSVLTRWKKRQSNNIIIIADVIRNSSLFCSEVRLQCERERKKEPNTFTNTHMNAKAHAQIDPLYLNLSCPVGC